jgi:hypothetical protein
MKIIVLNYNGRKTHLKEREDDLRRKEGCAEDVKLNIGGCGGF